MSAPRRAFLLAIVGLIIAMIALVYAVWNQHQKIQIFQPIEATVVARNVIRKQLGSDIRYEPMVRYQFQVEGQSYISDTIATDKLQGSLEWAKRFIAQFPVGKTIEAYCDPKDPSQSLLLKEYNFSYYGGILFVIMFLAGAIAGFANLTSREPADLEPVAPGLYEIKPRTTLKSNICISFAISLLWYCVGVASLGHYFTVAEPPYQTQAKVFTFIYGFTGLVPVGLMVYWLAVYLSSGAWQLGKTRLFVGQDKFNLGNEINVQAEQRVRLNSLIDKFGVGLVCEKAIYQGYERRVGGCKVVKCHDDQIVAIQNYNARLGEMVTAKGNFLIPSDASPSNLRGSSISPYCGWRIEISARLARSRKAYRIRFPILVQKEAS